MESLAEKLIFDLIKKDLILILEKVMSKDDEYPNKLPGNVRDYVMNKLDEKDRRSFDNIDWKYIESLVQNYYEEYKEGK